MLKLTRMAGLLAAITLAVMWGAPAAQAQATRTWISGVGDDANPCSRTAPCKTFAGAISKTAAGGEIDCLDPGGFGAVTVTKSITLDCGGGIGGQAGSILASGTNGITINAAATDQVKVRNLTINGIQKSGSPGIDGIRFLNGAALIVEHVGIFSFGGTTGTNGGISFEANSATTTSRLTVIDTEIQYGLADGILIKGNSSGGSVTATLDHVSTISNAGSGVRVDNSTLTGAGTASVVITNSLLTGNATALTVVASSSVSVATITVTGSSLSNNTNDGILASGSNANVSIGQSTVAGNALGALAAGSSTVKSFGDNYFYNGAGGTNNGTVGSISKF
jgi:hypothetical protein